MRKKEIKEVALELFAQKGYHDTSMQEIADIVGITKAALYFYFKSKADIYLEIMNDIKPFIQTDKGNLLLEEGNPESALKKYFIRFISDLSINQILLWKRAILASILNSDQDISHSTREILKKRDKDMIIALQNAILEKKPEMAPEELRIMIISYANFIQSFADWMLLNHVARFNLDNMEIAEKLWEKFWNGSKIE